MEEEYHEEKHYFLYLFIFMLFSLLDLTSPFAPSSVSLPCTAHGKIVRRNQIAMELIRIPNFDGVSAKKTMNATIG